LLCGRVLHWAAISRFEIRSPDPRDPVEPRRCGYPRSTRLARSDRP
jgi:hypothetical protein